MSKLFNICLPNFFFGQLIKVQEIFKYKMRSQTYVKPQLRLLEIIFTTKKKRETEILWSSFVQWNIHNLPIKQRWKPNVNYIKYYHQTQYMKLEWGEVLVNIMKAFGESKVKLHSILTNNLNGGERLTSRPSCFHRRRCPTTNFIGG